MKIPVLWYHSTSRPRCAVQRWQNTKLKKKIFFKKIFFKKKNFFQKKFFFTKICSEYLKTLTRTKKPHVSRRFPSDAVARYIYGYDEFFTMEWFSANACEGHKSVKSASIWEIFFLSQHLSSRSIWWYYFYKKMFVDTSTVLEKQVEPLRRIFSPPPLLYQGSIFSGTFCMGSIHNTTNSMGIFLFFEIRLRSASRSEIRSKSQVFYVLTNFIGGS